MNEPIEKETAQSSQTCSQREPFEELFCCECHDSSKVIHLTYYAPIPKDPEDLIWMNVTLPQWRGFFSRVKAAFLYLFGKEPSGGLFNTPCLQQRDMPRLIALLDKQVGNTEPMAVKKLEVVSPQYLLRIEYKIYEEGRFAYSEFSFDILLPQKISTPRKIWRLLKYVFGFSSRYGEFDQFELNPEQTRQLKYLALQHAKVV